MVRYPKRSDTQIEIDTGTNEPVEEVTAEPVNVESADIFHEASEIVHCVNEFVA